MEDALLKRRGSFHCFGELVPHIRCLPFLPFLLSLHRPASFLFEILARASSGGVVPANGTLYDLYIYQTHDIGVGHRAGKVRSEFCANRTIQPLLQLCLIDTPVRDSSGTQRKKNVTPKEVDPTANQEKRRASHLLREIRPLVISARTSPRYLLASSPHGE